MADSRERQKKHILRGNLTDLPPLPSRTVRVFLSSTFSDYYIERNELMRTVFPELRSYCQSRGLDFQVVDMRWGVSETAGDDHKTSELCIDQIRSCQKISAGPNFVAFLGQRYGYRPIPAKIESKEFESLLDIIRSINGQRDGLEEIEKWYREDTNAMPPVYRLQEISSIIKDYRSTNAKAKKAANQIWWATHDKMQTLLRWASTEAYKSHLISETQRHVYFRSVTEEEVFHGLLEPDFAIMRSDKLEDQGSCFLRLFNGVEAAIKSDSLAKKYFEKVDDNVDTEGMDLLDALKQDRIPKALPERRIREYPRLEWTPKGVDPNNSTHKAYLDSFCKDVKTTLLDQINQEQRKKWKKWTKVDKNWYLNHLMDEILHNSALCAKTCKHFVGRDDILNQVKEKLTGTNRTPIIIHGSSGVGRTAVVAKVIDLLPSWLGGDVIRVFRFLRTTTGSTLLYDVLYSVLAQLKACGQLLPMGKEEEEEVLKDSITTSNYFGNFCIGMNAKVTTTVVIVLDTIDGLKSNTATGQLTSWLPTSLADNIKIVISVKSGEENCHCFTSLKERVKNEDAYVPVGSLNEDSAIDIFKNLMAVKKRTLTGDQYEVVVRALERAPSVNPLLVSLMVKEARQWKSYQPALEKKLECSVDAAIHHLLSETERRHGVILSSHALAYMTASKHGLSDLEMEDLLSVDNRVLQEVYWIQKPPNERILRIPGSLWQRIRYDLRAYLEIKMIHGIPLVIWAYRQFTEVARSRYGIETYSKKYEIDLISVHTHLSKYFMGEYSDPRKIQPVVLTIKDVKCTYSNTDRQIPKQPLQFGPMAYNHRMMLEAPYHLIKAKRNDELYDKIYLNPSWLNTKIKAEGPHETIADFSLYMEQEEDPGIRTILHALYKMSHAHPDEFEADLCARLLDFRFVYPDTVGTLIDRATQGCINSRTPCLVPLTAYAGESGHLHHTIPREKNDKIVVVDSRSKLFLLTSSWDLTVYHMIQGDSLRQIKLNDLAPKEEYTCHFMLSEDTTYIYILTQTNIEAGCTISCHIIDIITLKHVNTYTRSFTGQGNIDKDAFTATISKKFILASVENESKTIADIISLPFLDSISQIEENVHENFVGIAPREDYIIFRSLAESRSIEIRMYNLSRTNNDAMKATKITLRTMKETEDVILCTSEGLIHAQYLPYRQQLEAGAEGQDVTLYSYITGVKIQELNLTFCPTSVTYTDQYLIIHFPWKTRVYDIRDLEGGEKVKMEDTMFITKEIASTSLGYLFVIDSNDLGVVFDLSSGAVLEEWYPGCKSSDIDMLRFCKNSKTGSLYLLHSFTTDFQSLIKFWRPTGTVDERKSLPPITQQFYVSLDARLAVGLRKDFSLYSMNLNRQTHHNMGSHHNVVAMSISTDNKLVAVVREIDLDVKIDIYDIQENKILKSFSRTYASGDFDYQGIEPTMLKRVQCLGFACDNTLALLRVPINHTDALVICIELSDAKPKEFRILISDGGNLMFHCKKYGDILFHGFHGGSVRQRDHDTHAMFAKQNLKTGEREMYTVPQGVQLDDRYLYSWRGSPSDYTILSQTRPISNDNSTKEKPDEGSAKCYVIYSISEYLVVDLDSYLKKIYFHAAAFAGTKADGGLVHISVADRNPVVSYTPSYLLGSVFLMSNVCGGRVTVCFDRSDGCLTLINMISGDVIMRYHLQGDTLGFANPAHLHATPNLEKILFSSDGAAEVAIFAPNKCLSKILDPLRDLNKSYTDSSQSDDSTESCEEVVVLNNTLCCIM